jgi:hypothetical protein
MNKRKDPAFLGGYAGGGVVNYSTWLVRHMIEAVASGDSQ